MPIVNAPNGWFADDDTTRIAGLALAYGKASRAEGAAVITGPDPEQCALDADQALIDLLDAAGIHVGLHALDYGDAAHRAGVAAAAGIADAEQCALDADQALIDLLDAADGIGAAK
jgi:hypothetical protein